MFQEYSLVLIIFIQIRFSTNRSEWIIIESGWKKKVSKNIYGHMVESIQIFQAMVLFVLGCVIRGKLAQLNISTQTLTSKGNRIWLCIVKLISIAWAYCPSGLVLILALSSHVSIWGCHNYTPFFIKPN